MIMESAPSSPTRRVKFLCSHGGRILLRPSDGRFKYVGGQTRAVVLPRDVTFSELMKKMNDMFEEGLVLKYELASEDLETLVTVRSDQDIKHMLEEHDRHQAEGRPMLRAFLFPSNPNVIETINTKPSNDAMQQRYIDAINGLTRTNLTVDKVVAPASPNQPFNNIASPCMSPKSPYSISPEPPETNPSNPNPNPNSLNHLSVLPQPQLYYPNPRYRQNLSSYHLPMPPPEMQNSVYPLYQIVASQWYPRVGGGVCGYYVEGGTNGSYDRGDGPTA